MKKFSHNIINQWVPFENFGCWYRVEMLNEKLILLSAPMLKDGGIELDASGEIDNRYPEIMIQVNEVFGTDFKPNCK